MAKEPNISQLSSGFRSSNKLNENFEEIKAAFDKTLSRDGSGPNHMEAALDMNENRIINVGAPVDAYDLVRQIDLDDLEEILADGAALRDNNLSDLDDPAAAFENLDFDPGTTDSVVRSAAIKLSEIVSSNDYTDLNAATASFGTNTPSYIDGHVYVPNGTHLEPFVAGQATKFEGQARGSSVVQATSAGPEALLDARITRGTLAPNTWGAMQVENLTVSGGSFAREGVCLYGGGSGIKESTIQDCDANGLHLQYVLKTTIDTVTSVNNTGDGLLIDTDAIHTGDVNTSINVRNFWSLNNDGYGMRLKDTHYSTFNMTTQGNGLGGIYADGTGSSVAAGLSFIGCASEVDNGPAFHGVKLRDFLIADFFLLANPAYNSFIFDGCTGTVIGLTDQATHTGGTYTVSIINSGLGAITFIGGSITIDPAQMKYCVFVNTVVNGVLVSSVNRLDVTDASDVQSFYLDTTPLGGDYSGLGVYDATGLRVAAFRRFNGGVVLSSGGGIDPTALNNGDFIGYVGTTTLTFQAKGTDGVVRTGTVALA